jgi:hypothetical protein
MALMICSRSRPARRTTGEVTLGDEGWQPEHAAAPAGGSAATTAAVAIEASPIAAATTRRIDYTIV